MNNKLEISIIIPLFNEEENLIELYRRLTTVLNSLTNQYELIFVDDGSIDKSLLVLNELKEKDNKVKTFHFMKNSGKATALAAGFKQALGKIIVTMDADLQDIPEEIPALIAKLKKGYDLICGWRFARQDSFFKLMLSKVFNKITSLLTGVQIHDFNCGLKAHRREIVPGMIQDIKVSKGLYRYLPVFVSKRGYRVSEVKVAHQPRTHGESKFGWLSTLQAILALPILFSHIRFLILAGNRHQSRSINNNNGDK